jgi:PAS domain S-box-containing protein
MTEILTEETIKDRGLYRRLLLVSSAVYFIWWFAVEWTLPGAFNPFLSRLAVVLFIFSNYVLSFKVPRVVLYLKNLFLCGIWLITLHYFYLFHSNHGEMNWIIGAYITVIAINLCFYSSKDLLAYSLFVFVVSVVLVFLIPPLKDSVFLPGMVTILLQANLGMRSRLQVIKNLAESNQRFQLLFNSTFEGVLVHQNGKIVTANESLLKMLGYQLNEVTGKSPLDFLHPGQRQIGQEKLQHAEVPPYETKALTKLNQIKEVEIRAKEFAYGKAKARLVTVHDISDRKRIEEEKIKAMTLAENIRLRDDFLSIASHELKTPIAVLSLQLQLIEKDLPKDSVNLIGRQLRRLSQLVETMLDLSKISTGLFILDKQAIDLIPIIQAEVASISSLQEHAQSQTRVELRAPNQLMLIADPLRLAQVIENLLTNAFKYGLGKPVIIEVGLEGSQAVVSFKDHGMGIPSELLPKIFDRFQRGISARNISGFGLGLYIARQIIQAHGGKIEINSEYGHGSTVKFLIPTQ